MYANCNSNCPMVECSSELNNEIPSPASQCEENPNTTDTASHCRNSENDMVVERLARTLFVRQILPEVQARLQKSIFDHCTAQKWKVDVICNRIAIIEKRISNISGKHVWPEFPVWKSCINLIRRDLDQIVCGFEKKLSKSMTSPLFVRCTF